MSNNPLQALVDRATQLIQQVNSVDSFDAVRIWDDKANEISGLLKVEIDILNERISDLDKIPPVAEKRGLLQKLFGGAKEKSEKGNLIEVISKLQSVVDALESWIDRTPDSIEEAKALIAEYKLLKKELSLAKKEATTAMRDAREQSRNNMANMTFMRGKTGRFARDIERLRKERSLSKHQSLRDEIESQIIAVEKRIIWLEKIARG
jgi:hypothetical protein